MKKIDFHIHTVANKYLDNPFNYNSEYMTEYIKSNNFDMIAITNHNLFDASNFNIIENDLKDYNVKIFPGIEISLEEGHVLVIAENNDINKQELCKISKIIESEEMDDKYKMSMNQFNELFANKNYLIIPHLKKNHNLQIETINCITDKINVGEVDSQKHFFLLKKEGNFTPVRFSDIRIGLSHEIQDYQNKSRFTYLDCDNPSLKSIKESLKNANYVELTKSEDKNLFEILNGNAYSYPGINVLLGNRSSGKTYTLNHINEKEDKNTLYIQQFEIAKECTDTVFKTEIKNNESEIVLSYNKELLDVFDYIDEVYDNTLDSQLSDYVSTLKKNATNSISDLFSKSPLFNFEKIENEDENKIKNIYDSVFALLDSSGKLKNIVENHISFDALKNLLKDIICEWKKIKITNISIDKTNEIAKLISTQLGTKSSAVQIKDVSFIDVFKIRYASKKFNDLINNYKSKIAFSKQVTKNFSKEIKCFRQTNKTKLKSNLRVAQSNSIDYLVVDKPIDAYIKAKGDINIRNGRGDNRCLFFVDYDVSVLNENNKELSGGQRAEYILLNKLLGYQAFDTVLIDEMESSFDNPFINKEINSILHNISNKCTIFISTHNNNIGVSLKPDYYIYHEIKNNMFLHYCGRATDEYLVAENGDRIKLSDVLLSTMEASKEAYKERNDKYEIIED